MPSTLPLGHRGFPQYLIHTSGRRRNSFVSLKLEGQSGVQTCDLRLSKQAALTTAPEPPRQKVYGMKHYAFKIGAAF